MRLNRIIGKISKKLRKNYCLYKRNIVKLMFGAFFIFLINTSTLLFCIAQKSEEEILQTPQWDANHPVARNALKAAELLLQQAINLEPDQLTWPVPESSSTNITYIYEGFVKYVSNETLGQAGDDEILSIDIGDADNDGDNDIVIGTSPNGLVILYENPGNNQPIQFNPTQIVNFSDSDHYNMRPTWVNDVIIDDLEGNGENSILVSVDYFSGGFKGDLVRFNRTAVGWQESEILNGIANPIPGGVYSIAVGDIGNDSKHVVVVGQGFPDNLDYGNVTVYTKELAIWKAEQVVETNQSKVDVCIGDYTSDFDGNEIVYCTDHENSILGYVGYELGSYHPRLIKNITGQYPRFMSVAMGDLEGDGIEELIVTVDGFAIDNDRIEIHHGPINTSIIEDVEIERFGEKPVFDDFDNDGLDEVVYCYTTSILFPITRLMFYDWNGTDSISIFLENTIEPFVSAMATGDVDMDGEIEFLYGTDGNGWLKMWDHPRYGLWPDESLDLKVTITLLQPWIYEGQIFPLTVNVHNLGPHNISDIDLSPILPENVACQEPSSREISVLTPGLNKTVSFNLLPMIFGQLPVSIEMDSDHPKMIHSFKFNISVVPKIAPSGPDAIIIAILVGTIVGSAGIVGTITLYFLKKRKGLVKTPDT